MSERKVAFIFPGQGTQNVGMGSDFFHSYQQARETLQEAEELLGRDLRKLLLEGPESLLTDTQNSQVAIFVMSVALLRVVGSLFPEIKPHMCSGLSLGEYTALTASARMPFDTALHLVNLRGQYMSEACEQNKGSMVVVLGVEASAVEKMVDALVLPEDIWAANFNCPGQVVLSGTEKGLQAATQAAKELGAKRVLPLQVHGAFHSGLMKPAEVKLATHIERVPVAESAVSLVMNVPGNVVNDPETIRNNLIKQVTHPVRWERGIRTMVDEGATQFVEIGCGKTLKGLNKRIGISVPTISIETVEDLKQLETLGVNG